jgi:hypothetical protein
MTPRSSTFVDPANYGLGVAGQPGVVGETVVIGVFVGLDTVVGLGTVVGLDVAVPPGAVGGTITVVGLGTVVELGVVVGLDEGEGEPWAHAPPMPPPRAMAVPATVATRTRVIGFMPNLLLYSRVARRPTTGHHPSQAARG